MPWLHSRIMQMNDFVYDFMNDLIYYEIYNS